MESSHISSPQFLALYSFARTCSIRPPPLRPAYKRPGCHTLPSLWKICKRISRPWIVLSMLSSFDNAKWQHASPSKNPRLVRGSVGISVVKIAQFVLKTEKLSHVISARITRLTVSGPDYGSWSDIKTMAVLFQILLTTDKITDRWRSSGQILFFFNSRFCLPSKSKSFVTESVPANKIKVIPQYCITHPYCALFLRH